MILYQIIQIILFILLGLSSLYILVFAIAGLFYRNRRFKTADTFSKFAVLIPGYKEDEVIVDVAKQALEQQYPSDKFDVVIIADTFQQSTLEKLKQLPIKLIEVSFDKSTKAKALTKAMQLLTGPYDIAVVLDADNIMANDFLKKINDAFASGARSVQGHRAAKNTNNNWAILDAVSEEINNHVFRKGHRALGLASAIIGSGMAFEYNYFKSLMETATAVGGFDKEIELKMFRSGIKIEYLGDAMVYDEKVQKSEVFYNQRRRWLAAQIHYFKTDILQATKDLLLKGNVDYFDKAMQFILPPRVLLLGSVFIFGALFISINYFLNIFPSYTLSWIVLIAGYVFALAISVPKKFYSWATLKAVAGLPKGMLLMLKSLLRIKGANKTFIHTQHTAKTINTSV